MLSFAVCKYTKNNAVSHKIKHYLIIQVLKFCLPAQQGQMVFSAKNLSLFLLFIV